MNTEYLGYTLRDIKALLMVRWEKDADEFKQLRTQCDTYVFDAVIAVLLSGTGSSLPEHKAYLSIISNSGDVGSWKANAGLRPNKAAGYSNYQQRGFFNYPAVDNKKLKAEFPEEKTIGEVCTAIRSYPDSYFRNNQRNSKSDPKDEFINTMFKVISYAMQSKKKTIPVSGAERYIINESFTKQNGEKTMTDMKKVYKYLSEMEPPIADSISYASELLLTELDSALKALKIRRMEAAESDDDHELAVLTGYRNTLNSFKEDISGYLDSLSDSEDELPSLDLHVSVDYSKYRDDGTTAHNLREDFMHKKIGAFVYEGTKFQVNTWKDALILLCNLLAKENLQKFNTIVNDARFKGRKHQYYSPTKTASKNVKIYGTNVYAWVNLSANSIAELMADTLEFFGKNSSDFKVYLRADYTGLHK